MSLRDVFVLHIIGDQSLRDYFNSKVHINLECNTINVIHFFLFCNQSLKKSNKWRGRVPEGYVLKFRA